MTVVRGGWLALGVAAACLALAAGACQRPASLGGPPERGDTAVATVNGQTIWASDVRREARAQGLIGEGEALAVPSPLFGKTLDQVVDQKLLAREAVKRRLDKGAVAQRRLAAARERVLSDLLVETVVARAVNDQAVQRLYQEQVRLAQRPEEVRARQIVVASASEAQRVRVLLAGGAAFEALALARSTDAETRFSGGDLGYATIETMPPAYAAALKQAQPGALVGPFPVPGGYAVVRVEDRRVATPATFAQAKPQIVRFLTYDEIRDLLARLRSKAEVNLLVARPRSAPAPRQTPPPAASAPVAAEPPAPPGFTPPGGLRPITPVAPGPPKRTETVR